MMRLPGQYLSGGTQGRLTALLAQMPDSNNGSHAGGLGSVLQKALMGWQMGKDMQSDADAQATMKQAGNAMAGITSDTPGPNPDGSAGYDLRNKAPDRGLAAKLLMGNERTAPMGHEMASQDAARAAEAQQWEQRFAMQSAKEDARFDKQLGVQREDRNAERGYRDQVRADEQRFRQDMLRSQQAGQREPLVQIIGADGRPKYARQSQAEGAEPYSPKGGVIGHTSDGQPIFAPGRMSAVQEKELFEADDIIRNSQFADKALSDAIALNPKAAAGFTAPAVTAWQRNAPAWAGGDPAAAAKTSEYNSIVTGQALDNLRAIFGGNPTEGERKILMDIQAAPTMSVEERDALLKRTQMAVQNRRAAADAKAQAIRGRTFETQNGPLPPMPQGMPTGQQPSIPGEAVQMLRSNPALASAFDAKYGPGAARMVLGQ